MENSPRKSDVRVTHYVDPRAFLLDLFASLKKEDPSFSSAQWADQLGLKSRDVLRLILNGKRKISRELLPVFIQGLEFSEEEAEYFAKIVSLSSASKVSDKKEAFSKVSELVRAGAELPESGELLSSPLVTRLITLLTFKDVDKTSESLARLLKVDAETVSSALEKLEELGLARCDREESGQWSADVSNFYVKDRLGSAALQAYHKAALEEAIQGISLPARERRHRSILIPLSEEEFEALYAELNLMMENLVARLGKDHLARKRLYQINLNLIPVSEELKTPAPTPPLS